MYLPLEYVKRYSVLTELYCSEEYINCEPEVLLEMIADADWEPVIIRVQIKKDIFIHIICLIKTILLCIQ